MSGVLDAFRLDGRAALVTGGSRGLGLVMARALGQAGARVMVAARREPWLSEAVQALRQDGVEAQGLQVDVSDPEGASSAVAAAASAWGRLDILVHSAGTAWSAPVSEMPIERWRQVLETNLSAAFYLCRAAAPLLFASPAGRVILVASIAGLVGQPAHILNAIGYSASKGGLIAFARDLAVKWAPYGVTVNAIAPGYFPTRLTEGLLSQQGEAISAMIPLGRLGEPQDLAAVAVFFASDASRYITGQVLAVDGGLSVA